MNASVTLSPTEFFQLTEDTLGLRKHIKSLVNYYQAYPEKVKFWFQELDKTITFFNQSSNFPSYCINALYLREIIKGKLPKVVQIETRKIIINKTLKAMDRFEFFDKEWELEKLAAACVVAFYRTYVLTKFPYLKAKNAQVASAIEESLALMELSGSHTELFQSIKHWIIDWREQGFSKELADMVISSKL